MLSYMIVIVVVSRTCAVNCAGHRHPLDVRQIRECEQFSVSDPSSDLLMNTFLLDYIIDSVLTSP